MATSDRDRDFVPTLRDVARLAGVSLATADRVVNKRPGVRPAKIASVEAAIADLNFERHAAAADLARRVRFQVAAILPRGTNPFMERLADELRQAGRTVGARRLDLSVIEVEGLLPDRFAVAIAEASRTADAIIAIGLDDALVRGAIDDAAERKIVVVTLVSDVPGSARTRYVGIDNRAAGRVAGSLTGRFLGPSVQSVGVLLGSRSLRDHRDRLDGFAEILASRHPNLRLSAIVEGLDDADASFSAMRHLLAHQRDLSAVYSAGAGNAGLVRALEQAGSGALVIAHELTAETRPLLQAGLLDALIVQDAGHEARSAVRIVLSALGGIAVDEDQERIRIEIVLKDNLPG